MTVEIPQKYGISEKSKPTRAAKRTKDKTLEETFEMIQLHFDPEENSCNIADKVAEIFRPEPEVEVTPPNSA